MFTGIYIEALLVDEDLADQVWEAWDTGEIDDATAFLMWLIVARSLPDKAHRIAVKPISGPPRAGLFCLFDQSGSVRADHVKQ